MRKIIIILFVSVYSLSSIAEIKDSSESTDNSLLKKMPYFGVALGVSASTNGLGINVNTALTKSIAIRLGYESINKTFNNIYTYTIAGQSFNISPTWQAGGISAIVDFYLLKGLYISGGAVYTNMNISATVNSGNAIKIGDISFQPDEVGQLGLTIRPLNRFAPYGALGFGRNISRDKRFAMSFELGTYYMRSYVIGLSGTNLLAANGPANQESLDKLNATLKTISWSGFYPVIKLGISYKIFGETRKK